jgi:hypothetical protein
MALVVTAIANGATASGLVALMLAPNSGISVAGGSEVFQGNTLQAGSYVGAKRTTVPPDAGNLVLVNPALGHGLSIDTGVVLATGRLRLPGDPTLTALAGGTTGSDLYEYSDDLGVSNQAYALPIATLLGVSNTQVFDPASLKFNFTASSPVLTFKFWFTSFEYEEFIGSVYTDTFVVLLDGINVALLPSTSIFISINSVNHVDTPTWFARGTGVNVGQIWRQIAGNGLVCDRRSGATAGEDGLGNWLPVTVVVTVEANILHTVEFLIADLVDGSYESAVFLPAGSLSSGISPNEIVATGTCGVGGSQPSTDNLSATGDCV